MPAGKALDLPIQAAVQLGPHQQLMRRPPKHLKLDHAISGCQGVRVGIERPSTDRNLKLLAQTWRPTEKNVAHHRRRGVQARREVLRRNVLLLRNAEHRATGPHRDTQRERQHRVTLQLKANRRPLCQVRVPSADGRVVACKRWIHLRRHLVSSTTARNHRQKPFSLPSSWSWRGDRWLKRRIRLQCCMHSVPLCRLIKSQHSRETPRHHLQVRWIASQQHFAADFLH